MEEINNIVWCLNIIAFSHVFRENLNGGIWKWISLGFILIGIVVLSF